MNSRSQKSCLEFNTKKGNVLSSKPKKEKSWSLVHDQKSLEFMAKKIGMSRVGDQRIQKSCLDLKTKTNCLQFKTNKKGQVLKSRLIVPRTLESKKVLIQYSGQRDPANWEICVIFARIVQSYFRDFAGSEQSGVLSIADCASVYARASGFRQYSVPCCKMQLLNQCSQLEKLKSTNSLLQKELVELRQKRDNHCDRANRQQNTHGQRKRQVLGPTR